LPLYQSKVHSDHLFFLPCLLGGTRWHSLAEALKPGHRYDSWWCHWNSSSM
jgi:hypothetical protein